MTTRIMLTLSRDPARRLNGPRPWRVAARPIDRRTAEVLLIRALRGRMLIVRHLRAGTLTLVVYRDLPRRPVMSAAVLSTAIQRAGLVEHGPRRIGQPGAPIASAAPISWGMSIAQALNELGFRLERTR